MTTPNKTSAPEAVRERLDQLIRNSGFDYASVSRLIGRNASYIQQFIHRGTPKRLAEQDRKILAQHFAVDETELGGVPARPYAPTRADLHPMDNTYVYVPSYDIAASAGPGVFVSDEQPVGELAFRREWIQSVSSAAPEDLAVVRVDGDSMYPTLADGDRILLDRKQITPSADGIYVLRVDDTLQVKRLLIHPATRQITVKSDNPIYEQWRDCDPKDLVILGRAVWVGRRL